MSFFNKVWYFFQRMKRRRCAYIRDRYYDDYTKEDRLFHWHYVEYDRKTGRITFSTPYTEHSEPHRSRFLRLRSDDEIFERHLKDFEEATGIDSWNYTMSYGDSLYQEYLLENHPDAVLARKLKKNIWFSFVFKNIICIFALLCKINHIYMVPVNLDESLKETYGYVQDFSGFEKGKIGTLTVRTDKFRNLSPGNEAGNNSEQ